jgi:heat shock protein HtpX
MYQLMDFALARRHRLRNALHGTLLMAGLAGLLGLVGWLVAGTDGIIVTLIVGAVTIALTPHITPALMLRLFAARRLGPGELPELAEAIRELSRRADLPAPPRLYYLASLAPTAFSVGRRDDAGIALSAGLLRSLTLRQIVSVMAHEVSHVRNNDMRIMTMADMVTRLTSLMAQIGFFMLILNLPLMLLGQVHVSWALIVVLMTAPTASALLQLALSRQREFQADLDAAELTGDPAGLASALQTLESAQASGMWERILLPGRRLPDPSLLRTHPRTEERVRRLLDLEQDPRLPLPGHWEFEPPGHFPPPRLPRWRWSGLWH